MRIALRLLLPLSRLPLIVRGTGRLPVARPCVLVANHASYLDGYLLVAALPLAFSFVAKTELQRQRGVGLALRRIGTEFVERFDLRQGVEDTRRLANRAREGRSLMFFPEGTFTRVPGLRPFHLGAFIAAAEAGVPVVPVAIRGTRSILRDGSWLPRRGTVTLHVGEPLEPEPGAPLTGTGTWLSALRLRDDARRYILRYCGEPDLGGEPEAQAKEG
jgi:1-acyl-sn-glycerol-3-phosphate acyltransferase